MPGVSGSGERTVTDALVMTALTSRLPSPPIGLVPVAGSVGNQDFMVHTAAGNFVLKIGDRSELAAEAWACERIREVGVVGPEVVAFEPSPADLPGPFLLMRRMPGAGLTSTPDDAFIEAGRQLRLVHSIRAEGYGFLADTDPVDGAWAGPHAVWSAFTDEAPACLGELVDHHVVSIELAHRIDVALDRFKSAVVFDEPGVLLHGDLKPPHVFAERGEFAGLIDWGDVAVGDPRYDLARFSISAGGALMPLLAGYGIELTDELRLSFGVYRVIRMVRALLYELRWGGDWFDSYRTTIEADLGMLDRLQTDAGWGEPEVRSRLVR
jgi:aminoglycoside phosphotransferase (APT) family kinase protein